MNEIKGALAFIAAANELSFTKAARQLEVSPQALAASVARMESALAVRLFNRSTRSIALTEEGKALLARIAPCMQAFQQALASVRDRQDAPSGLLRISTASAFGRRYVLPLLPEFLTRFPEIRLDIVFDDQKVDLVRDGFDIAIRGGNIADSALIARRICALKVITVASPKYLQHAGIPRTPHDLLGHRLIALRFASGTTASWDYLVDAAQLQLLPKEPVLTLSDTESVGDAAVGGLGITRVSQHFAWPHLLAGRLKVLLASFNDPGQRELVLHYPHREHIAPRVRVFADFVLAALQQEESLQASAQRLLAFAV
jgi:DNA-binding transcriptional LysR family regulator